MKKRSVALILTAVIIISLYFAFNKGLFNAFFDVVFLNSSELTQYAVPESGKGTGFFRHSYESLDETGKQAYALILQSVKEHPQRIRIPKLNSEQLNAVFLALSYDNPGMLCLGSDCRLISRGGKHYFIPTYSESVDICKARTLQLEEEVAKIKAQALEYKGDYEKEKFVHDLIIRNCNYTYDTEKPNVNSAYGAIIQKEAACEGYSRAFQLILAKLDIDVRLVTGKAVDEIEGTVGHMWNMVVLDGDNYFVDLTWDDPVSQESIIGYSYFNVTGDMIKATHLQIQPQIECVAVKHNYFVKENRFFNDTDSYFENRVKSAVGYAYSRGEKSIEFRFDSRATYEAAKEKMINGDLIRNAYELCGLIRKNSGFTLNYSENISALTFRLYLEA
ncbi:MAG: Transglutaminase-like superfamily protein [Firmicutes bacterium ADurb.Bin300]|nr:MAG: Transglutaminase-like superfamily protein [Firmicutes bacterium ADurb.Bin300]